MKISILSLGVIVTLILASCSNSEVVKSSNSHYEIVNFPDGSIAYLNKNSKIEYKKEFADRLVNQEGEVFYEVKHDDIPFTVKTKSGEIKVLGTKFNVKATDKEIEVEVETGTVELKVDDQIKKIQKGQKALFKKIEKDIKVTSADFNYKKWRRSLDVELQKLQQKVEKNAKDLNQKAKSKINKALKKIED